MIESIAVVGLACRFPGAADVTAFWDNLLAGREGITRFDKPDGTTDPRFVGAEGKLDDIAGFDAEFFGYSPREAAIMDPQHRVALETAWAAFDSSGYEPSADLGPVGVFLASAMSSYLIRQLLPDPDLVRRVGGLSLLVHNDKDFAATTVSHKLGLTGPSYAVGSACSSSLAAVHLACRSLESFECDMALAGGVSLLVPQGQGYVYAEDGIYSPDGRCAPFDETARGTVGGSGVGVVLLKRLSDAVRDGDRVHAVILGSAVNNDGAAKAGYTAPSVTGQSAVIAEAHAAAGVGADTIGYVEAHGAGTEVGDPIEVAALTRAFRLGGDRTGYCALGSVKSSIGHLDAASGIAGLIKAILTVRDGIIPGSLHYRRANPRIDFAATPFFVADATVPWHAAQPRRAGVSSFGVGGTNVHVVLEQPQASEPPPDRRRGVHTLMLSARTESALTASARELADYLRARPEIDSADVATTLAGRRPFGHRLAVLCRDTGDAVTALDRVAAGESPEPTGAQELPVFASRADAAAPRPVFVFPGQGGRYPGMAMELAERDATFGAHLDECDRLLSALGVDLRAELARTETPGAPAPHEQVALFAVEYCLAVTLRDWGITPAAMLGHSLGEYAAATVAGVLSLPDAVRLVSARGRLAAALPPGRMLAVSLDPERLRELLPEGVEIAAVNAVDRCVAAGDPASVAALAAELARREVPARLLDIEHAFHTAAVEPMLGAFRDELARTEFRAPTMPYVSSVTGTWASGTRVTTPRYWLDQLRAPVRFGAGLARCLEPGAATLIEVGPDTGLARLARRLPGEPEHRAVACLPSARTGGRGREVDAVVATVAALWTAGCPVDRAAFQRTEQTRRTWLPAYPFQRQRYWIDPESPTEPASVPDSAAAANSAVERASVADLASAARPAGVADSVPDAIAAAREALFRNEFGIVRGIDEYAGLRAGLTDLCAALADRYLRSTCAPGTRAALGVRPEFERFRAFLVELAESAGALSRSGDTIVFTDPSPLPDPEEQAARIVREHPEFTGMVELLTHCAAAYPVALSRAGAALGVLYPRGDAELLERTLGERTVEHRATIPLVRAVAAMLDRLDGPDAVRVVEIGAGAGTLTRHLVSRAAGRLRYHATDISPVFTDRIAAHARRAGLEHVDTGIFDIAKDPVAQGMSELAYDLVCGLDVVHATPDIPTALAHLRALLAPGGVLALIETVADDPWVSMIWGLSPGWWDHTDGMRRTGPLLDSDGWRAALTVAGFDEVEALTPASGPRDSVLLLARAPVASESTVPQRERPDVTDWGYRPSWRHAPALPTRDPDIAGICLLYEADGGGPVGAAVAARLEALGVRVIRRDPNAELLPEDTADVQFVVHLAALDAALRTGPSADPVAVSQAQDRGLHSLIRLARALGSRPRHHPVRLVVATAGTQDVLGDDLAHPEYATVLAAVKVLPREYPWLACTAVDAQARGFDPDEFAGYLVAELACAAESAIVAYRGRRRFQPDHLRCPLPAADIPWPPRRDGVYLICGGLGGIGTHIAEFLGRLPARVVLLRRRAFPEVEQWSRYLREHAEDDPDAIAIRRLRAITDAGGDVLVVRADLTDAAAVRAAVDAAERRFGPITGVVHAAGVPDLGGMVQRRTHADTTAAIAAKVQGTAVLDAVLGDRALDFFVLCSSLGTVLHKLKFGEIGYVAGNEYLQAFAAARSARRAGHTVAIAWTDWQHSGMWAAAQRRLARRYRVDDRTPPGAEPPVRPSDDLLGALTPEQGVEVLRRVLDHRLGPQILVSTRDLGDLLDRHRDFSTGDHLGTVSRLSMAGGHRRDRLHASYAAPASETERTLARWYAELLGYDRIGRDDDFFALGGDSLVALRLLAMVRGELGAEVSVAELFERPTVAGLGAAVAHATGVGIDRDEVIL
ncbi:SDR family NAD(P)-dependent oxidoreductase [Nocardia sp. NPDC047038]|uniref:type I polyketide synthase n=1 Tax=Nocardia sp. NPDC047038 TaxID=3154338 RepID=UPI00340C1364